MLIILKNKPMQAVMSISLPSISI